MHGVDRATEALSMLRRITRYSNEQEEKVGLKTRGRLINMYCRPLNQISFIHNGTNKKGKLIVHL